MHIQTAKRMAFLFLPYLVLPLLVLPLAACAGADKGSAHTADSTQKVEAEPIVETTEIDDAKAQCVEVFVRQRECTDEFIPALVDARIRLDRPAGIAERASSEGRDPIIAEALTEWAVDSQDDKIDASCDQIISTVHDDALVSMLAATSSCLEQSECSSFAACIVPVIENLLK